MASWPVLVALLAAGCSVVTIGDQPRGAGAHTSVSRTPQASPSPSADPPKVSLSRFVAGDGTRITLARFSGAVTYRLHSGSGDPGSAALRVVQAGPRVSAAEQRVLLGAFNGGFKLSTGSGGYEQEGHVIAPLRRGVASLVIDTSGHAQIGVWGNWMPLPGEAVYSVRQNLGLLVSGGQVTASASRWRRWGATLGGGEVVARSALGQDAAGDLIYAASMATTPADLAAALVSAGARAAMELDINPEWVQLDVASQPGGQLSGAVPGQHRPADQYLVGWTRDFITVLGSPAEPQSPAAAVSTPGG
ncbi:MAG: hypothetical protein J2P27_00410 [Actinobacteria bacterium]|nr:hypothetical protein [Actinomycetota bacterium]